MWTGESGYFRIRRRTNWCPVSCRTINQYGSTTAATACICRHYRALYAHALNTFYCRGALGTRVNPDTIGWVWIGKFDLNTLRVDREIFKSGKNKLRIQKYPDTCGRGLIQYLNFTKHFSVKKKTTSNQRDNKT